MVPNLVHSSNRFFPIFPITGKVLPYITNVKDYSAGIHQTFRHIWTPPFLQAGIFFDERGLRSYIRLRDGTVFVPSLDGCRAAAPMHPPGLITQPMTRIRVGCCGGAPFRPSGGLSCYAILGSSARSYAARHIFVTSYGCPPCMRAKATRAFLFARATTALFIPRRATRLRSQRLRPSCFSPKCATTARAP